MGSFWTFIKGFGLPIVVADYIIGIVKPELQLWYKGRLGLKRRIDGPVTHGDARLADFHDLYHAGMTTNRGGFLLGWIDKGNGQLGKVFTDPEHSVVMYGQAGSGKSQLLRANFHHLVGPKGLPDVICLDPVGEHQLEMESYLEKLGYAVGCLNMVKPEESMRYDPLVELQLGSSRFQEDVRNLCHLIIPESIDRRNEHFRSLPRRLLAGSIVYHMTMEPEKATLNYCLQSVVKPIKELQQLFKKFEVMKDDATVHQAITVTQVVSDREYSGFVTSMVDAFDPFLLENWKAITQPGKTDGIMDRGWSFREMYERQQPTFLFVRIGPNGKVTGANGRLIIGNAVNARTNLMHDKQGGHVRRDLKVFADEASLLGNCEALPNIQNFLRKARCRYFLCFQTRAQVFNTYPNAKDVVQGAIEIFTGGQNDWEAYEYVSRFLGHHTVMGKSESKNGKGLSESEHEVGVRVKQAEQLFRTHQNELIFLGNRMVGIIKRPFQFKKGVARY